MFQTLVPSSLLRSESDLVQIESLTTICPVLCILANLIVP